MTDERNDDESELPQPLGGRYANWQFAQALETSHGHANAETRIRAQARAERWMKVIQNMMDGGANYGSRTPLPSIPAWVTPEVATGGFATGALLAGGHLRPHEVALAKSLPNIPAGGERAALNSECLTSAGLLRLTQLLNTRKYQIDTPEESALLAVAWLADHGDVESAWQIIEQISPFFDRLRFYPVPLDAPRSPGSAKVHRQTVGQVKASIAAIQPNARVLAQKESVNVWAPFHDRVVALFVETEIDGWPCRQYAPDWAERANLLLAEYRELRTQHNLSRKAERPNQHYCQLREWLGVCARDPKALTGREVGRIKLILQKFREKRGNPGSPLCATRRNQQVADAAAPAYAEIVAAVLPRLERFPADEGVDDLNPVLCPITREESAASGIPANAPLPEPIQRRLRRCLHDSPDELIRRGIVTSGDTLAAVLSQLTGNIRSAQFADLGLQDLYSVTYQAFQRRRSLLLLNLEKQVRLDELPWIKAIEPYAVDSADKRERSRLALTDIAKLTLAHFPYAMIPNKLLKEMAALAEGAGLDLPFTEEVAADIFMGRFSAKFLKAAQIAAAALDRTFYAAYYRIDYEALRTIPVPPERIRLRGRYSFAQPSDPLALLCAQRAGVPLNTADLAANGMIIEQQQILTTQNLAVLFDALHLRERLEAELPEMAKRCFAWICLHGRRQSGSPKWRARLIFLKNSAYAWRQMVFFLSFVPQRQLDEFTGWATHHLHQQREPWKSRFAPAVKGLQLAASHTPFEDNPQACRLLGWSNKRHWLLPA